MCEALSRCYTREVVRAAIHQSKCDPTTLLVSFLALAALGLQVTGILGLHGVSPFANLYGYTGSIAAVASGGVIFLASIKAVCDIQMLKPQYRSPQTS